VIVPIRVQIVFNPSGSNYIDIKGVIIMDELMKILQELRPDVDFENETALITDGILDSFDIVALVGELNDAFDIEIKPNNLVPENFNSAKAMMALIEKLQDE